MRLGVPFTSNSAAERSPSSSTPISVWLVAVSILGTAATEGKGLAGLTDGSGLADCDPGDVVWERVWDDPGADL